MLVLTAALALATIASPTAVTQDSPTRLELRLDVSKSTFVLYEPITLVYRVTNPTPDVITSNVSLRTVEFLVKGPDGKTKEHPKSGPIMDVILDEVRHEPGAVTASEGDLAWQGNNGPLPVPGVYEVRARVYAGTRPTPVYLESNTVKIEVRQPSQLDSQAIASFASEADFRLLLRDGATAYCAERKGPTCLEELESFLRQHSQSAYAPMITWYLASAVANDRVGAEPKYDVAVGLFRQFLERWPDHPNAPKVMYGLAMTLDRAGRSAEAAEVMLAFEKQFPEQRDKANALRTNFRSGELLPPKP